MMIMSADVWLLLIMITKTVPIYQSDIKAVARTLSSSCNVGADRHENIHHDAGGYAFA